MANKLKDIFSNDTPEYKSTINFKDSDAYQSFHTALITVEREGRSMPIDGIDSISTFMKLHGIQFPIDQSTNISDFIIYPAKDYFDYTVNWDGHEKVFKFERYRITSGTVLETGKNEVVYMKLVFSEDSQKVKITYNLQYQNAKSIKEIEFEMNACIVFLEMFYEPTVMMGKEEEVDKIGEIFRYLRGAAAFVSRLCALEKELKLSFSTASLNSMSVEDQQDVEELYLLICERIPLRLNAKINSTDTTQLEIVDLQKEPAIGEGIALAFVSERCYKLLEQEFSIFTANALINAIIKDIQRNGEKTTIFYGDSDSHPMYISFSGYLTEEQAKNEISRNIGGESIYINARTSSQYIKEYYVNKE